MEQESRTTVGVQKKVMPVCIVHAVPVLIYEHSCPIGYLMSCDHEMLLANKMAVASSCSIDEAIRKSLHFSKCGRGKTKEMYRFIAKKEG